jgi:hypothetical protein
MTVGTVGTLRRPGHFGSRKSAVNRGGNRLGTVGTVGTVDLDTHQGNKGKQKGARVLGRPVPSVPSVPAPAARRARPRWKEPTP